MYLWETESLAEDIKNNEVSQRDWMRYYLALSGLLTLGVYLVTLSPGGATLAVLVEAIAAISILIVGIRITYKTNKGDNGVDYIARMTALSLPVAIKLFVISVGAGIVVGALEEMDLRSGAAMEWDMIVLSVILQMGFFWRLNVHLKHVNS